jgi:hypothetical protein
VGTCSYTTTEPCWRLRKHFSMKESGRFSEVRVRLKRFGTFHGAHAPASKFMLLLPLATPCLELERHTTSHRMISRTAKVIVEMFSCVARSHRTCWCLRVSSFPIRVVSVCVSAAFPSELLVFACQQLSNGSNRACLSAAVTLCFIVSSCHIVLHCQQLSIGSHGACMSAVSHCIHWCR